MRTLVGESSMGKSRGNVLATSTKTKVLAILEVLVVYAVIQTLLIFWRSTELAKWEARNLGWYYIGTLIMVGIPALVIWLTRRSWAEYGLSLANWRTNLDIGTKACPTRIFPYVIGWLGTGALGLDPKRLSGGALVAVLEGIGLAWMLWMMSRHKPVSTSRKNVIAVVFLLLFPIGMGLAMGGLKPLIVSTVVWQFVFSGFGEEFVWRGYVQSRLNQAFGRPLRLFGIQFGAGLIVASLLFGLLHAFNTYDAATGFSSLAWGWALSSSVAGLLFGAIRERTGTLLAPGIAHGLPDAAGEALARVVGWM